ncbi:MAG: CheR family methyltransferase [Bacteroidota bacterium]|nr:CheR family methyltransferase [Bacteroidota bacterium]
MFDPNSEILLSIINPISVNIEKHLGLYYPPEKYSELYIRLDSAAKEKGYNELEDFLHTLQNEASVINNIDLLTRHLTIGETYFFRESGVLDIFKKNIINNSRPLNIWCAGCCTGEEAYTLAIIINSIFDSNIRNSKILATDINKDFLNKALSGRYSKWSFRNMDDKIVAKYFNRIDDKYFEVRPEIRKLVKFEYMNLAENNFSSKLNFGPFDYIFCRNVLMYFDNELHDKLVTSFYNLLADGGFLAVSVAEVSLINDNRFEKIYSNESFIFRKSVKEPTLPLSPIHNINNRIPLPIIRNNSNSSFTRSPVPEHNTIRRGSKASSEERKQSIDDVDTSFYNIHNGYAKGRYAETISIILDIIQKANKNNTLLQNHSDELYLMIIKSYLNINNFDEALRWCTKGIENNRLHLPYYLTLANIFQVINENEEAMKTLQTAIYLDPDNILANFSLSNLYRRNNDSSLARKYLLVTLRILENCSPDQVIEESEGLTAGAMREMVISFIQNIKE